MSETASIAPAAGEPRVEVPDHAPHVLVVDDDRRLRELIGKYLAENGFRVTAAASAAEARAKSEHFVFDALVLDVMMPGETGFEYASAVRETSDTPILMLTARAETADRITGLEIGADDYLAKPFEPRELLLRLTNILKRAAPAAAGEDGTGEEVRFGPFVYRLDRGELRRGEEAIRITEREREILTILGSKPNENVPREALSGAGAALNERTVDVQINRLRRKIELDPANPLLLQTVRGVGYKLVGER